ncbi:MAG: dihydrofolate reductase [Devosia sp.]|nr:dihydrofolate reductase [Devosia sp.]
MQKQFFVIGGETIYAQFINFINQVWLTEVFTGSMNGDAKFEYVFNKSEWWIRSENEFAQSEFDEFPFRLTHYIRRKEEHRTRAIEDFRYGDGVSVALLDQWLEKFGVPDAIHTFGEQLPLL